MGVPEATIASIAAYRNTAKSVLPQQRLPAAALSGVLTYIGRADRAMAKGDVPGAHAALIAAQQILAVLRGSLYRPAAPELVDRLDGLYAYAMDELGRSNYEKDRERLTALVPVIATLHEAWESAATAVLGRVPVAAGGGAST